MYIPMYKSCLIPVSASGSTITVNQEVIHLILLSIAHQVVVVLVHTIFIGSDPSPRPKPKNHETLYSACSSAPASAVAPVMLHCV